MTEIAARFLLATGGDSRLVVAGSAVMGRIVDGVLETFGKATDMSHVLDVVGLSPAGAELETARLLAGWVPGDLREEIATYLGGTGPPLVAPQPASPALPMDVATLDELVRQLTGQFSSPGTVQAMSALGTLPASLMTAIHGIQPPPGSRWDMDRIAELIRETFVKWLYKIQALGLPGENSKRVMKEIDTELTGPLQKRAAIAAAITIGGMALTSVSDLREMLGEDSSYSVGTAVHEHLQEEYRETRPSHRVVEESRVWQWGRSQSLRTARRKDDTLLALWWARDAYLLSLRSALKSAGISVNSLRDDILDLTGAAGVGTSWEIKSVRGACFGVVQEFVYRTFFNLCVAILKDIPGLHLWLRQPNLRPIKFSCEHAEAGRATDWPEAQGMVLTLSKKVAAGRARTILVIMIDALPGVVLYTRYDIPAGLVAAAAAELVRDFNKAGKEIGTKVRHGLAVALVIATACVIILLAIVVVIAAIFAAPEVGLAELIALLTPILARLGEQAQQIMEALRRLIERLGPVVQEFALTMTPVSSPADGSVHLVFSSNDTAGALPTVGATMGSLRLDNCPIVLLAMMDDVMAVAGPLAAAAMLKAATSPPDTGAA